MKHPLLILAFASSVIGALFFAWYHQLIIIRLPGAIHPYVTSLQRSTPVTLWYHHNHTWHQEQGTLPVDQANLERFTHLLLEQWLAASEHYALSNKQVNLQTVAYASNGTHVYISLNRTPWSKQESTYQKWLWVESLLKTLRTNGITASYVHLLHNHAYLHDPHLLFTTPWPLGGFLEPCTSPATYKTLYSHT